MMLLKKRIDSHAEPPVITRHDLISSKVSDGDVSEDADRLRAANEALADFCFAVEHSKPNSRVGTLGLA